MLASTPTPANAPTAVPHAQAISRVIGEIRAHPDLRRSVAQLAHRCGLSRAHFSKLFVQFTGRTPARFLLEQRIAWAARLLQTTDDGIEDIALRCGFADRFQFSHAFRRVMNGTPAGYRRTGQVLGQISSP